MVGPANLQERGLCWQQSATAQSRMREAGPVQKVRFVGLDVHKESIAIAVADDDGSAPENVATIPNDTTALVRRLKKLGLGATLRCCYEAGPTGYVLHRALREAGIDCIVIAPSLVPKTAGDRVKTDRRDAVKLARFLRSGDLTEVHVPEAATEAMRDLERSRAREESGANLAPSALEVSASLRTPV